MMTRPLATAIATALPSRGSLGCAASLLGIVLDLSAQLPFDAKAGDPNHAAQNFARSLRGIHKRMALGRFTSCRTELQRLLERHRGAAYVLARKAELLEDFRRCTFHIKHPKPTLAQAIDGKLLEFRKRTGRIALEYTPKSLRDFDIEAPLGDTERQIRWHGMVFKGPYSIELSGRSYTETVYEFSGTREIRMGLNLHVGRTDRHHLEIACGNQRGSNGHNGNQRRMVAAEPLRVLRWTDAGPHELHRAASPARLGRPFRIRVEVDRRFVRIFYNDQLQVKQRHDTSTPSGTSGSGSGGSGSGSSGSRSSGNFGTLGIEGQNFDKLLVKGQIHPNWLTARVDERIQQWWFEFDRVYDGAEVPDWLATGSIPSRRSFHPVRAWPDDVEDRHHPVLREFEWLLIQADFAAGLEYIAELPNEALPPITRSYLLARFHFEADELERAARQCEKLCRAAPSFLAGRRLRAEIRVRQGQGEQAAIDDYRAMITAHPDARALYIDLAVLLIQARRTDEAASLLQTAVRRTGNVQELMHLQRLLDKVVRGPAWARTFEARSTHYLVKSNIDAKICQQATKTLETARRVFAKELGMRPRRTAAPARVFLFAGQTGYQRFCHDILGERDTHTDGFYSGALKQLLIWNLPNGAQMLRTIRHEGFHQFLDSLVHDSPAWFDEGFAEYFESVDDDHLRPDHLDTLSTRSMTPLAKFVRMPLKAFYRGGARNYAQAWAIIHFLRHGDPTYREVVAKMFQSLRAGRSPRAAVKLAFAKVDFVAMQKSLTAHLARLRQRR